MTDYLLLSFIFLAAGIAAVPLATRLGLGSVLGYLTAGIMISPLLALLDVDVLSLQHFAEFGVVMMLFLVGLELEPERLWRLRHRLIGLGGLQLSATTGVVMLICWMLGERWSVALAVGLVLALSSTAIVLQSLNEKGLMSSDGGQSAFSVLLFQDIAVIPMLALMPLLAIAELQDLLVHAQDTAEHTAISLVAGLPGWQATLITIGALALVILAGRRLTTRIFDLIAATRLRELFNAAALMMVIGVALLMQLVGLSPALGTFIAGVMLATSDYRHELESDIEPFKGLLLGVFFMTVGAGINFTLFASAWVPIVLATLGLIAVKVVVLLVLAKLFHLQGSNRWLFALSLAQAGEFGFVLLSFTVNHAILPQALADQLLLIVALSMLLTPVLFIIYDRVIAPRYADSQQQASDEIDDAGDIIIAGHGRFGGVINRMLRGMGLQTTVVDFSASQLDILRNYGIRVYYGDATRPDLLEAAGIGQAKLLIVAIDGREQINKLVQHVLKHYPNVHVIARAWDRNHVFELYAMGCRDIIRETYDGAIRTGRSALEALGVSGEHARHLAAEFEVLDRNMLEEVAGLHSIDRPNHENPEYVAKMKELNAEREELLRGKITSMHIGGKKFNR